MFQFDSNLIQVELGNKAMQVFATKDTRGILDKLVGQAPPGWADDLIRATNQLKDKLEQEGIYRILQHPHLVRHCHGKRSAASSFSDNDRQNRNLQG